MNPTADQLLQVILRDGKNYEVTRPLENGRKNKVYTVKEDNLEKITCDDNGAYLNSRTHDFKDSCQNSLPCRRIGQNLTREESAQI